MSGEDIRVNRLKLNQQNVNLTKTQENSGKSENPAEITLFENGITSEELRIGFGDINSELANLKVKGLQDAVQRGFAGLTSYADSGENFNFDAAIGDRVFTSYHQKLDALLKNSSKLSQDELKKIFKELSGMELEEYLEKKDNLNSKEIQELLRPNDRKYGILDYYLQQLEYGKETMQSALKNAGMQKEVDFEKTKNMYQTTLDNEGFISWCMNGLIYCFGGTTRDDVNNAIIADSNQIPKLQEFLKANDIAGFMAHYKHITGVTFNVGNFKALAKSENRYQVFAFADRFKDASKYLFSSENFEYVQQTDLLNYFTEDGEMLDELPTTTIKIEQTNYNLNSLHPAGVIRNANDKNSPLENALMKLYGDKEIAYNWIQSNIERLNLKDKSPKEKYEALVNEFYACEKALSQALKEQFGNIDFKQVESEYKADLQKAYGNTMSQEALDNYMSNQAVAHGVLNMAVLIGAGMFAGPAALTSIVGSMSAVEKMTDKNGLTGMELVEVGGEMALSYAGFKVFGFASQKSAVPIHNYLIKKGLADKVAGIATRQLSSAIGGASSGMFTGTVAGIMQGKDLIDSAKQGFSSALSGAAFALAFGAIQEAILAYKAANLPKVQLKTAKNKLVDALSSEKDAQLNAFAKQIKKEGLSKDLLSKIIKQAGRVHHPDVGVGANPEAMAAYNILIKELNTLIKNVPNKTKATSASENTNADATVGAIVPAGKSDTTPILLPNVVETAKVPTNKLNAQKTTEMVKISEEQEIQRAMADIESMADLPEDVPVTKPLTEKVKDGIATVINKGTDLVTKAAPFMQVYGEQLPAMPLALSQLAMNEVVPVLTTPMTANISVQQSQPKQEFNLEQVKKDLSQKLTEQNRFDKYEISDILDSINEHNKEFVLQLCSDKRLRGYNISVILNSVNELNKEFLPQLLSNERVDEYDIDNILKSVNENNKEFVLQLCSDKRLSGYNISKILNSVNELNKEFLPQLLSNERVGEYDIDNILKAVNEHNKPILEQLLQKKKFTGLTIKSILESINDVNEEFIPQLLTTRRFESDHISSILKAVNEHNRELVPEILANKKIKSYLISRILEATNNENLELAKQLLADIRVPNTLIESILKENNPQFRNQKLNFVLKLSNDNIKKQDIFRIVKKINETNFGLVEQLSADEKFPIHALSEILAVEDAQIRTKKIELAKHLYANEKIPSDAVGVILQESDVNAQNNLIEKAKKLLADENFDNAAIKNALTGKSDIVSFVRGKKKIKVIYDKNSGNVETLDKKKGIYSLSNGDNYNFYFDSRNRLHMKRNTTRGNVKNIGSSNIKDTKIDWQVSHTNDDGSFYRVAYTYPDGSQRVVSQISAPPILEKNPDGSIKRVVEKSKVLVRTETQIQYTSDGNITTQTINGKTTKFQSSIKNDVIFVRNLETGEVITQKLAEFINFNELSYQKVQHHMKKNDVIKSIRNLPSGQLHNLLQQRTKMKFHKEYALNNAFFVPKANTIDTLPYSYTTLHEIGHSYFSKIRRDKTLQDFWTQEYNQAKPMQKLHTDYFGIHSKHLFSTDIDDGLNEICAELNAIINASDTNDEFSKRLGIRMQQLMEVYPKTCQKIIELLYDKPSQDTLIQLPLKGISNEVGVMSMMPEMGEIQPKQEFNIEVARESLKQKVLEKQPNVNIYDISTLLAQVKGDNNIAKIQFKIADMILEKIPNVNLLDLSSIFILIKDNIVISEKQLKLVEKILEKQPNVDFYDLRNVLSDIRFGNEIADVRFELVNKILEKQPNVNIYDISTVLAEVKGDNKLANIQFKIADMILEKLPDANLLDLGGVLVLMNDNIEISEIQLKLVEKILEKQPMSNLVNLIYMLDPINNEKKYAENQLKLADKILEKQPDADMVYLGTALSDIAENPEFLEILLKLADEISEKQPGINLNDAIYFASSKKVLSALSAKPNIIPDFVNLLGYGIRSDNVELLDTIRKYPNYNETLDFLKGFNLKIDSNSILKAIENANKDKNFFNNIKYLFDNGLNDDASFSALLSFYNKTMNPQRAIELANKYDITDPEQVLSLFAFTVGNFDPEPAIEKYYDKGMRDGLYAVPALVRTFGAKAEKVLDILLSSNVEKSVLVDTASIALSMPDYSLDILKKMINRGFEADFYHLNRSYALSNLSLLNNILDTPIDDFSTILMLVGKSVTKLDSSYLKNIPADYRVIYDELVNLFGPSLLVKENFMFISKDPEIKQKQYEILKEVHEINSKLEDEAKISPHELMAYLSKLSTQKDLKTGKSEFDIAVEFINNMQEEMVKRKDILKSGNFDLTDDNIKSFVYDNAYELILLNKIIGKSATLDSFNLKIEGLAKLAGSIASLWSNIAPEQQEAILQVFNTQESAKGKRIEKIVQDLRKKNSELAKIQDLSIKKAPMKIMSDRMKKLKTQITTMQNTIKGLSTKDKIAKLRVLSAISDKNPDEINKLLSIIKSGDNNAWVSAINKEIFKSLDLRFDEEFSSKLGLQNSEYLAEIFSANEEFKINFKSLVDVLLENPNLSIQDALETLEQNKITRKAFEERGLNYDRWINPNKNLYEPVVVTLDSQKAKQATIIALEADLNDNAFKLLPKEETQKIIDALNAKGFELVEKEESLFDENGFNSGIKKYLRLYQDGKPIEFSKMENVVRIIKNVMNTSEFWSNNHNDPQVNEARKTIYEHITKLRDNEVSIASRLTGEKTTSLEIRQTDMMNIAHSLFLGNHGACCTAVGSTGINQFSAPTYIKNRLISAIEIVDGKNFVGNTMCYIAEVDGETALVLDNIELNAKYQNNDSIRDAFINYVKKFVAELGKPDLPIYAGPYRHKFNMEIFDKAKRDVKILGSTGDDEIYIDYVGHYTVAGESENNDFYKIQ